MDMETQYVKISVLPIFIYKFNATPVNIPGKYFLDISKFILKFIWKDKRPRIVNTLLKERTKSED